jgi:hypothetical protein
VTRKKGDADPNEVDPGPKPPYPDRGSVREGFQDLLWKNWLTTLDEYRTFFLQPPWNMEEVMGSQSD